MNTPILTSGSRDDVLGTNISVSSNSTSFINSNVPIVPLLFVNTLVRLTSPVAGSRPSISMSAKDCEFCVSVYAGVASYDIEYADSPNSLNVCGNILWLLNTV